MEIIKAIWDFLNDNSGVIGMIISAVGFLFITRNQLSGERFDERLSNMKKTIGTIASDRNRFMEDALKIYREKYKDDKDCDEFEKSGHLIYRNDWLDSTDKKGDLYKLSDIQVRITGNYPSTHFNIKRNSKLPDRNESYADNCKFHLEKTLFDAPLYAIDTVSKDGEGKPELAVLNGSYFDFYNTCEYLSFEIAYANRILGKKNLDEKTLPERFRIADLFDTHNRFAGIGINTLTIIKNVVDDTCLEGEGEKKTYFLLHKRGTKVAEGMGNYHVIPAGSYQPICENTDEVVLAETMKNTVLREFGEELLEYEEFLDLQTSDLLRNLDSVLEPYYLGIGFEPLNTKAEVLSLLVLDMDNKEHLSLLGENNKYSELLSMLKSNRNYEGDVYLRPLTTAMLEQYEKDNRSTASLKEIMRIMNLKENRDRFGIIESE